MDVDHERIARAVFFPRPDQAWGPAAEGARDHLFDTDDGSRLRLRVHPGPSDAPALLFFHGNGETARDYDFLAADYRSLPARLLVAEYRGYGPCSGSPSVDTFLPDAHRTLDEARALLEAGGHTGPLVVMGRSLGSAPAIELAANRADDVSALIVESGFARIVPLLELVGVPARRAGITEEWGPRNLEKMRSVRLPTLIMHAEEDQIIPFADARLLADACADPDLAFLAVPGAGHNDIQPVAGRDYFERIATLLDRVVQTP